MNNQTTININGKITPKEDAKISIFDRGFLFGDSIYEVTYTTERAILFVNEHLDRLYQSANLIQMNMNLSREKIIKEVLKTLKAANIDNAYIRIIVTRGESEISLDPTQTEQNNFIIIVKPRPIYSDELYSKGISLKIVSVLRNDAKAINPSAKSGNYLNNIMALKEAKDYGYDDALMMNKEDYLTEGTTFNIWMIKDNCLYTPPVESGLLEGITREKVINLCNDNKLALELKNITEHEILSADEVFITSSTRGIMPVFKINDKIYSEKSTLQKISNLYKELVLKELCLAKKHYTY